MEIIPVKYLQIKNLTYAKIYSYLLGDNPASADARREQVRQAFTQIQTQFQAQQVNSLTIRFNLGRFVCTVRYIPAERFGCFINIIEPPEQDQQTRQWNEDMQEMIASLQQVLALYPDGRLAEYDVLTTGPFKETREAYTFLQKVYSETTQDRVVDCGISYTRVVVAKVAKESLEGVHTKRFVLIPYECGTEEANEFVHDIFGDLAVISIFEGQIKKHYEVYNNYLLKVRQIEEETTRRVEEISIALRGKPDLTMLEGWVITLSREFSDLSLLASQLTSDQSKAMTSILNNKTVYSKWNELSFGTFPTVSGNAMRNDDIVSEGFKNVIGSVDITRNKLGDLLTIIRTYINIEQQRHSLEMQESLDLTMKANARLLENMGVIMREAEERRMQTERQSKALEDLSYIFAGFGLAEVVANLSIIFLGDLGTLTLTQQILLGVGMLVGITSASIGVVIIGISFLRNRRLKALEAMPVPTLTPTNTLRVLADQQTEQPPDGVRKE